ncbi:primosomal protein N' [Nonomuraea sp. SMC257]|uniref:Probable replication restart protein PriA n=1 Tax=Nonomuraea montanisoli TaxID=2741721 RepID=A0A7Y6I3Z2_9ACTN|nr:primosomal protein N' [Nonomuraea montanisoli]NUW31290.1 primosomal protein N' [Nonomuraea montanisoli]
MTDSDDALLPLDAVRPAVVPSKGAPVPAPALPVARVAVDNPLPHLDRPFDYLVPASMHESAQPGVRVRVRFAGKLVDGFLLERAGQSEHVGALTALERVVSAERVLTPEIAGLARAVADRYAGTLADVLRLAVPPRHAKAEAETPAPAPATSGASEAPAPASSGTSGTPAPALSGTSEAPAAVSPAVPEAPAGISSGGSEAPAPASSGVPEAEAGEAGPWDSYPAGASFLAALRDGRAPRAVWQALPGARGWAPEIAQAVRATLDGGRGAVVVVPDGRDVALADAALSAALNPGDHVALTADLGPAERYRRWLRLLRGQARAVVGTRAAMFAPVADLGLVAVWDDGDDLHAERLAPYPHAREVLALRAHRSGAAMLIGGHTRTAEATQLIAARWARPIVAARQTVRSLAPRVRPAGEDAELAKDQAARAARLPSLAWRALRQGLEEGPVLVQVPRRGYLPAVACQQCRAPARCAMPPTRLADRPAQLGVSGEAQLCHGPLALRAGHAAPFCRWCGRVDPGWRCPHCGGARLRAVVVGARRTAEELGRAFPSTPVRTSGRDGVLASVPAARALVVATPGAEPVAEGGYAAAVLLDAWSLLGRADLRASEEALRRWMNAAALLRPAAELVVLADAGLPAVQALLRWDPITHAERELADRAELGFPPAVRMATLTGASAAVRQMLDEVRLPAEAQVLGPVPIDEAGQERAMIRVPRPGGAVLAAALKGASGVRAARKAPDVVRVSVDPLDLI